MKINLMKSCVAVAFTAALCASPLRAADTTEALNLKLPASTLKGTPEDLPKGPHIEPPSDKAPVPIQVPAGVVNVAAGKPVTASVVPFQGELNQITDGKKEPLDDDSVEMKKGVQWVQVDLGQSYAIHAIAMWHDHRYVQAFHAVVVQASDDAEFKTGVTTLYNNDVLNTAGFGVGTDREYFEMRWGRVVPGKGAKGRYVRSYTKGSSLAALNCWEELEVYALPAK